MPDIKPRSRQVTDGLERAAARGMLRAVGMGDEDFTKPQVAIASSWNEITPCNLSLKRLATSAKEGVHAAGGYPLEFGTISVSDGISMGHEGMHFSLVSREVIADAIETACNGQSMDGVLAVGGCDKNMPGAMLAMARMNIPSVFVYGGTILPGIHKEKNLDIVSVFEAVGSHAGGSIDKEELTAIEKKAIPVPKPIPCPSEPVAVLIPGIELLPNIFNTDFFTPQFTQSFLVITFKSFKIGY